MFSIIRSAVNRLPAIINKTTSMFHLLSKPNTINTNFINENKFLLPITPTIIPNCGFKVKGRLRRRCKDCYFVVRQQRLFVICKTHPRHKQMAMVPKEKNTWILTAATQGKIRPW